MNNNMHLPFRLLRRKLIDKNRATQIKKKKNKADPITLKERGETRGKICTTGVFHGKRGH